MTKLEKAKIVSDIIVAWVGLLALILGGGFAFYQYLDKVKGDSIKVTLDFLERQHREPFATARRDLLGAWAPHEEPLLKLLARKDATRDDLQKLVLRVVKSLERLTPAIVTTVDFYDSLHVCVQTEICDGPTARALFQEDARVFWNLHSPYLEVLREARGDSSFAGYLEEFVTTP
jgi:hypothetical protein